MAGDFKEHSCDSMDLDPVQRQVRTLTAAEVASWLTRHGLKEDSISTVESNLRAQFQWHRLQGRLDMEPLAKTIAMLIGCWQDARELERPLQESKSPAPDTPDSSVEKMCRDLLEAARTDGAVRMALKGQRVHDLTAGDIVGMANLLSKLLIAAAQHGRDEYQKSEDANRRY